MVDTVLRNAALALVGVTVVVVGVVMVLHYRAARIARAAGDGRGLTPAHVSAVSASQIVLLGVGAADVHQPLLLPPAGRAGLVILAALLSLASLYLIGRRQQRSLSVEVGADSARAAGTRSRHRRGPGGRR